MAPELERATEIFRPDLSSAYRIQVIWKWGGVCVISTDVVFPAAIAVGQCC